jgi:hypothetical protein
MWSRRERTFPLAASLIYHIKVEVSELLCDSGHTEVDTTTHPNTTVVGSVKVKLNDGEKHTIEFLPAAVDGDDPIRRYCSLLEVAKNLEQILDMQIGRLELSLKGEWVIYNPLAKAITNTTGRVTVDGIGMINASLPGRFGEFEFHDPRTAAEFLVMPGRLAKLEQDVDGIKQDMKEILNWIKQQGRSYSENKGGELVVENQAA